MEIHERIKLLRKDELQLSRLDFGKRLGVTDAVINNIERGRLARPEQKEPLYKLICKEFNVSYAWLTTGQGDMYIESKEAYFDNLANQYGLGFYARKVLEFYGSLNDERKKIFETMMKDFIYTMIEADANGKGTPQFSVVDTTIERIDAAMAARSNDNRVPEDVKIKTLDKSAAVDGNEDDL